MSERIAIQLSNVGKMYKMFPRRLDGLLDVLGLTWLMPNHNNLPNEFWALRGIDLEIKAGTRLGIIGRNGAGKSTLLKLITQNKAPTEGTITVNGQVQALLEAGAGFHPEFTGYENIRASLVYQGIQPRKIQSAIADIEEFTELGQFLSQPFKTYSSGMQARLTFATATVLNPDILIVDEILGAGDAYFAGKSLERMKSLVENSNATVLIVSHALDQILRYCDESVWLERGKIVMRGPSMEVIKGYEKFVREMEDRRLRAKNRKRLSDKYDIAKLDILSDSLVFSLKLSGEPGVECDVSEIILLKNGQVEDTLRVGDVQDASELQTSFVILSNGRWSNPKQAKDNNYRSLIIGPDDQTVSGDAIFYSYLFFDDAEYSLQLRYRSPNHNSVFTLTVARNGELLLNQVTLPTGDIDWVKWNFQIPRWTSNIVAKQLSEKDNQSKKTQNRRVSRWPGEASLTIEDVKLFDSHERETNVIHSGENATIQITLISHKDDNFTILPNISIFRLDGVLVTKLPGKRTFSIRLRTGQRCVLRFCMTQINLGDGHYIFSVGIFQREFVVSQRYDLLDRSFEFKVVGNESFLAGIIFKHLGEWELVSN